MWRTHVSKLFRGVLVLKCYTWRFHQDFKSCGKLRGLTKSEISSFGLFHSLVRIFGSKLTKLLKKPDFDHILTYFLGFFWLFLALLLAFGINPPKVT